MTEPFESFDFMFRRVQECETAQGDVLPTNLPNARHGEGDYLICKIGEDGDTNLSDVRVLNGLIFPECYDTSHSHDE